MKNIGRFLIVAVTLVGVSGVAQAASLDEVKARIHENGSGVWMREQFPRDLEPIALTPGGAGTLVVLYSQKADLSIPLCTGYDLVMGVKKGKVKTGWKCGPDRCGD